MVRPNRLAADRPAGPTAWPCASSASTSRGFGGLMPSGVSTPRQYRPFRTRTSSPSAQRRSKARSTADRGPVKSAERWNRRRPRRRTAAATALAVDSRMWHLPSCWKRSLRFRHCLRCTTAGFLQPAARRTGSQLLVTTAPGAAHRSAGRPSVPSAATSPSPSRCGRGSTVRKPEPAHQCPGGLRVATGAWRGRHREQQPACGGTADAEPAGSRRCAPER